MFNDSIISLKWKEDQLHFDLLYTVTMIMENGVFNIVIRGWCVWMKMEEKEEFQYIINEIKTCQETKANSNLVVIKQ